MTREEWNRMVEARSREILIGQMRGPGWNPKVLSTMELIKEPLCYIIRAYRALMDAQAAGSIPRTFDAREEMRRLEGEFGDLVDP